MYNIKIMTKIKLLLFIKEKYQQLLLYIRYGGITTINIHKRYAQPVGESANMNGQTKN